MKRDGRRDEDQLTCVTGCVTKVENSVTVITFPQVNSVTSACHAVVSGRVTERRDEGGSLDPLDSSRLAFVGSLQDQIGGAAQR